jgi:hypothetical protein
MAHENQKRGSRVITGIYVNLSFTNVAAVAVEFVDGGVEGRDTLVDADALTIVASVKGALGLLHDHLDARAADVSEPGAIATRIAAAADAEAKARAAADAEAAAKARAAEIASANDAADAEVKAKQAQIDALDAEIAAKQAAAEAAPAKGG